MPTTPPENLKNILEAALLAADQPLSLARLAGLFEEDAAPTSAEISHLLEELAADTEERGVELVEVASGWRYQVRRDYQPWIKRLWAERRTRYSRALLETLALIAYRQPVTRGEIEQVRGVAVSTNIVRTLEEREWIRVVGHREVPGKPALYGTTKTFLDYFQLKSLDELPTLGEIRDLENFNPQLEFKDEPVPAQAANEADADSNESGADAPEPQGRSEDAQDDATQSEAPAMPEDDSPDDCHAPTSDAAASTENTPEDTQQDPAQEQRA